MNILQTVSLIVLPFISCHGELFFVSSTPTQVQSLIISSNESLLISVARIGDQMTPQPLYGFIAIGGIDRDFTFGLEGNQAIAGPTVLKFSSGGPVFQQTGILSFERITGGAIHSAFVTMEPTTINVPAGKTCHFFNPCAANAGDVRFTAISGTNVVRGLPLNGGDEFSGPVSLAFTYQPSLNFTQGAVVSYYFNEESLVLPSLKLTAAPTGNFSITVEKSIDLTNWHAVAVQTSSSDQRAFYRFRIEP